MSMHSISCGSGGGGGNAGGNGGAEGRGGAVVNGTSSSLSDRSTNSMFSSTPDLAPFFFEFVASLSSSSLGTGCQLPSRSRMTSFSSAGSCLK